ncbi:MAG: hypothetical protein A2987_03850 [Omnitrophica bacterium RIFCSPLOWO2_01_FULL_45_10]|nr:MAG: hypothetical protein A2987_03850 [Omnitrophica bacterium RIFCSPLOWO2_01_FULL_45_10]
MRFYPSSFIVKNLQESMFRKYSPYIKGNVLDVGCGTRPHRRYLANAGEYVGMDENKSVAPDVLGSAQEIPFPDAYFDCVLCTEVLEHLPEPEKAVNEIKRVMKKGGILYLTVPQEWGLHYEPNDYLRFTRYGIKYLLEKNGFRVEAVERIGGIFSLVGDRLVDVKTHIVTRILKPFFGLRSAENISRVLSFPASLMFYFLGKIGDGIDKRDAICWAVLAVK